MALVFESAKWLTFDKDNDSVFVRCGFSLSKYKKVTLRIIGLGFFKFWMNGKTVTNNLFNQMFSNYGKRDFSKHLFPIEDNMDCRIYYSEYDVSGVVKKGDNLLAVAVGNGWFRRSDRYCEGDFSFSQSLQLVFEIEADGKIVACSDERAVYHETHIVSSTLYNGEIQDFAKEIKGWQKATFNANGWKKATYIEKPDAALYKCACGGDKIVKTYAPKKIFENKEYAIYDCGYNQTGFLRFASAARQENIRLEYAEECSGEDIVSIYQDLGEEFKQSQKEEYRNVPKGKTCQTQFTWYGFRYVKVVGKIKNVRVCVVNSGFKRKTKFKSSDPVLNWYYETSLRAIENNIHMGVIMDCPHRERYGYTGDGQICCDTVMMNFDTRAFYEKWLGDIADSQDKKTGYVQHTAPYMGGGGGPAWGIAIVVIPWEYYKQYGNKQILQKYLPNMRAYLQFLIDNKQDGLVREPSEKPRTWLGDWSYPDKQNVLPIEFVATYYLIKGIDIYENVCKALGEDVEKILTQTARESKKAFINAYFDESNGDFFGGKQGANAFALDIGLGDARTMENLCEKYASRACLDTGIYGTKILMDVLSKNDKAEIVYKLLSSTQYPSFGWWKEQGATSLWEDWSGNFFTLDEQVRSSQNHSMFSASQKYLFESLLGIKYEDGEFTVTPKRIAGLKQVSGTLRIGKGNYVKVKIRNTKKHTFVFVIKGNRSEVTIKAGNAKKELLPRVDKKWIVQARALNDKNRQEVFV